MINNHLFFGVSLTASFLAGGLALFAPCCITFLFPSYLGCIFKNRSKVMIYTLIFALGLSIILLPVALGFRTIVFFFDQFHREVYYIGGLFLILMGISTIKPFFHFSLFSSFLPKKTLKKDKLNQGFFSAGIEAFSLGVISGLSSSCCAPVLFAAVTLTSLSPTFIQALIVALAYVLGIVFPLFFLSFFYEKITEKISGNNRQKIYRLFQWLGAVTFFLSGLLIIVLNFLGKIEMYQMDSYSKPLRLLVFRFGRYFQNFYLDVFTFGFILVIGFLILTRRRN